MQSLILDGLSVTAELCHDIFNDASFSVRILSIRDVRNLNHGKLRGALQYACRPGRPENTPRLKALYIFGPKNAGRVESPCPASSQHSHGQHGASIGTGWNHKSQTALTNSLRREGDSWWHKKGRIIARPVSEEWVSCMLACEGLIAFDAVLCRGPRHRNSHVFGKAYSSPLGGSKPASATFAVRGCEGCGSAPEGVHDAQKSSPMSLPLLAPPPVLSSSIVAATMPHSVQSLDEAHRHEPSFVGRCADCLRERYCAGCHKWWCENCYQLPSEQAQLAELGDVVVVEPGDGNDDDIAVSMSESLQSLAIAAAAPKIKVRNNICHVCTADGDAAT